MNALLDFDRRHGFYTGVVGSFSGALSFLFSHSAEVTTFAGMIGAVATACIAVLALVVKVVSLTRSAWGIIRRWRKNAEQRRLHQEDVLPL